MFKTILIADDSTTARMVTKRCLEIAGSPDASFLEAASGVEALELAKANNVDLLVTDLNMPEMDGVSLLKHVKSSPRLSSMPVIIISSLSNLAKEKELVDLGATAVIPKPVTPAVLAGILEDISSDDQADWG